MPSESSPICQAEMRSSNLDFPDFLAQPFLKYLMTLNRFHSFRLLLCFFFVAAFFAVVDLSVTFHAQTTQQIPSRTGYVNDFAGVVDDATRQRLEVILQNLKARSGIEFDLVAVQTTDGKDIFDFSRQVAMAWDVGARSSKKSLLLVVSVLEKSVFTQFSRSVQRELPEGILGELSLRMRSSIESGKFSEGLSNSVQLFIDTLAKKSGLDIDNIDQAAAATPADSATSNNRPVEKATDEAGPALGGSAVKVSPTDSAASISGPPQKATDEAGPALGGPAVKVSNDSPARKKPARFTTTRRTQSVADDEDESEQVELTLTLPLDQRVTKLKEFLQEHPNSKSRDRAIELLVSAHAGLGDKLLSSGDSKSGIDHLMTAISEAPDTTSEKLFSGVIAQIPLNLYLRGQRIAAFEAAQIIETKFGADPKRLLALTGFYLGIEQGNEAARLASQALKMAPDLVEAHHALGLGLHLSLRLDEAAAEYKRALELDPTTKGTRRSLADLYRAAGKTEEALALYREQLVTEPADKTARAGMVLSLFELGRVDEADKELTTALQDDPRNLALLTGASYWFAAHNQPERALEMARKSAELEPRYTWTQISLARALVSQKKPLEAERAIRFAKQYGKFPTLDYELASVLAAVGLYEEAAEALQQSFVLEEEQIEAKLAGRVVTRASNFIDLLAPERRASIFQFVPADSDKNAAMLKSLLSFAAAMNKSVDADKNSESAAVAAAKDFASGDDEMLAYRQLYAASRLLRKGIGLQTAYELTLAAKGGVDKALEVPAVTVAVQADEYRDIRAHAIAKGGTPDIAEAPRNVLSNILRGRIEDFAGWGLFNQGKPDEAVEHLQRAANVLPEGTPSWRSALWHLGAALEQVGQKDAALSNYMRSYNAGDPDTVRRGVIEQLYQKINGSLDGLDQKLTARTNATVPQEAVAEKSAELQQTPGVTPSASAVSMLTDKPVVNSESATSSSEAPSPSPSPELSPSSTPAPEAPSPSPSPELSPSAVPAPESPSPSPSPELSPSAAQPEASPSPSPESTPSAEPSESKAPDSTAPPTTTVESTPSPRETNSPLSDEALQAMAARTKATIKIMGQVRDANNNGLANVVVVLISPRGTVMAATTDSEGRYSFIVPPSRLSYRIIPSKDGFRFDPIDKVLEGLADDPKELDFIGGISRSP